MSIDWRNEALSIAGVKVEFRRAGKGKPIFILHHDTGMSLNSISMIN